MALIDIGEKMLQSKFIFSRLFIYLFYYFDILSKFLNLINQFCLSFLYSEIAADEKEFLRQNLIADFSEPVNQLAVQLAVLIAKIAR